MVNPSDSHPTVAAEPVTGDLLSAVVAAVSGAPVPPSPEEIAFARKRVRAEFPDCIWVSSNRVDNRVVLFEQDPRHPGGQIFIGGDGVGLVFKTPAIAQLLHAGQLVEIPEPPESRRKPIPASLLGIGMPNTQPGQLTRLGRVIHPDLLPEADAAKVKAKQEQLPHEIGLPPGIVVPEMPRSVSASSGR